MGFWKIKYPSVIQKSTAKGSHGIFVAVGVEVSGADVDSGVAVATGILVEVDRDCATTVCTTGVQDVRKIMDINRKTNRFIMK